MKKREDVAGVITYECMKCGCEIIVSGAHESHLRPIYCCGNEVARISSSVQKKAKKIKRIKIAGELVRPSNSVKRKTVRKTSAARKNSGR